MTPKEILMQYADLFKLRSIPAWIFRYVEQFLFRLLYGLANGMETMVNHLASILAFFNQPEVQDFYQYLALASFVFLAIALMFQGYNFILGKRKTVSDLFRNTVLGVLFIIAIPWTMTQFLTIADASVAALGTDEEGNIMLAANVLYDNITDIEILAESGEWENLEARKNLSRELPFEALDLTEAADSDEDVLGVKLVSTGDSVVDEELDNGGLFSFWDEYYFRYSYDFLVILLEFLSLIVIYIFFSFKLISVAFELATTKLVAPFAINTDIGTGQKAKVVLKEMINGFATFVSIFYILRLYQLFTSWILAMDLFDVPILNAMIMIVAAFVVIDGTKTIPRIFGFDAGVKDGQATLMGLYAGTRLGAALGRGTKGLANGIGNSVDYNADKLGKWNENRQEAGGIGNHLQNGMQDKMNSFKHPLQTAQNAMRSSDLAHSFAQGGFQQGQLNDLAMETGATKTNAGKALQLNGNDPEKAKTYLQQMGMTNEMEDPQATGADSPWGAGSVESDVGIAGTPSEKSTLHTDGTGKKDLNAILAKQGGTRTQSMEPSALNENKNFVATTGLTHTGQSLDSLQKHSFEEANTDTESDSTSIAGADSHSLAQNSSSQSIDRVNQGNTLSERNVAVNERNEGVITERTALTSTGSAGTKGRINSDGTINVPRMENLLYEEDASFQPLEPNETSTNSAKSSYESVEVSNRLNSLVDRNIAVNVQNSGMADSVNTHISQTTTGSRKRINSDGTVNVPRMEQIVEDSPVESNRVQYETDSSVRRSAPIQKTVLVNRPSEQTDSKPTLRYVLQQENSGPSTPISESILETRAIDGRIQPRQKRMEDSIKPTKDIQNRNGNRK
ncbi:pLS20_p028 family conjugation system transmembrane protein [Trichococcus ilyis]|uniref:DUF8208 domain-containing protein n=1 Tax=Trichococcus ilyis TaxID=640938 RepID=A0A143Z760_9LACT|nr:hypothetical protein [Trichococcus ilyis]CZR07877.1 Hypothetical protein TR210_2497 [Trichococcus ilyis]SEJ82353.1 hypothetical protein SAMN05216375_12918 [Trichococcus ilyis]